MYNLIFKILLVILIGLFLVECSSLSMTNKFKNEYMPLAVGNKWYYSYLNSNNNDDIVLIKEVVSIDKIDGKDYAVIKNLFVRKIKEAFKYYSYLRISNDTLYKMIYDEKRERYIENADAIFSLELNDSARIQLDVDTREEKSENEILNLPKISWMNIKVTKKSEDIIEFYKNTIMVESEHTVKYKKGVGIIETNGSMSADYKLQDYKLAE
jgi:hypothetical protein